MLLTRSDGRRIRSLPPMQKIIPYIMRSRAASINLFQEHVDCTPLNNYIRAHEVNGQRTMSTMHLLIAAIVRVVAQRPQLNRFVVHSRVYARKDIVVSFVVHRSLRIEDGGTTIKLTFNGTESLPKLSRSSTMPSPEKPPPTIRRTAPINWPRPLCVFPAFSFGR